MCISNFMLFGIAPLFCETLLILLFLVIIINPALYCSLHHFRELWKCLLLLVVGLTVGCTMHLTSVPFYFSGIYHEPNCSTSSTSHGVLVVGYGFNGNETDGKKYWTIKNRYKLPKNVYLKFQGFER